MKEIIINNKATVKANGELNSKHCKPVVRLHPFKVYTSVTDAAADIGVASHNMSAYLNNKKGKTIKGYKFCFLSEIEQHYDILAENSQSLASENAANKEKARLWDKYQAEQNRLAQARQEHEERVAKANEKVVRRNRIVERIEAELAQAIARRDEAVNELNEINKEEVV